VLTEGPFPAVTVTCWALAAISSWRSKVWGPSVDGEFQGLGQGEVGGCGLQGVVARGERGEGVGAFTAGNRGDKAFPGGGDGDFRAGNERSAGIGDLTGQSALLGEQGGRDQNQADDKVDGVHGAMAGAPRLTLHIAKTPVNV
jgi:hypothetical protein